MAKVKKSLLGAVFIEATPKKTRQGEGNIQSILHPAGDPRRRDTGVRVRDKI